MRRTAFFMSMIFCLSGISVLGQVDSFEGSILDGPTKKNFRGHWMGIGVGMNNYLSSNQNFKLSDDASGFELDALRSWEVSINFPQYSAALYEDNMGFVTGLGFDFSNYRLESGHPLITDPVLDVMVLDDSISYRKSKLTSTYLTVPLIFEVQFPRGHSRKDRFHVSAGVIGGLLLSSNAKVANRYDDKSKVKREQHLSPVKYALTLRFGIKRITFFANYSMVPLFRDGKGPELYPVSIGIKL